MGKKEKRWSGEEAEVVTEEEVELRGWAWKWVVWVSLADSSSLHALGLQNEAVSGKGASSNGFK